MSNRKPELQLVTGRVEFRVPPQQIPKEHPIAFMDLSAIEERIMGMYGEMPVEQLPAPRRKPDIHTKHAMEIYGVSQDQVTREMRDFAKADNYRKAYTL